MALKSSFKWTCDIVLHKDTTNNPSTIRMSVEPERARCGVSLRFRLDVMLERYEDKVPDKLFNHFSRRVTSPGYDEIESKARNILTETVEGKEFLELVISNHTDWGLCPIQNATRPKRNGQKDVVFLEDMDLNERFEEGSVERWSPDSEYEMEKYVEENKQEISEIFGIPIEARYVIRLIDEDLNHWIYVGESTNLPNRLTSHIRKDGDFREAKRTNMSFLRVEEVRENIGESKLYEEACCKYGVPENRICGGI